MVRIKIADKIMFSPRYKFADVDIDNLDTALDAFRDRVEGFYLKPAESLNDNRFAFGSGVMSLVTVDYLSGVTSSDDRSKKTFSAWLEGNIPPFSSMNPDKESETLAARLYDEFRCGLVHEGHIKNAGQFSYESAQVVQVEEGVMIVNPMTMVKAIRDAFDKLLSTLRSDETLYAAFRGRLMKDFERDCEISRSSLNNDMQQGRGDGRLPRSRGDV